MSPPKPNGTLAKANHSPNIDQGGLGGPNGTKSWHKPIEENSGFVFGVLVNY